MACPNCGSWAVRSDRSLAGRMVCRRCGQPLGIDAPLPGRRAGGRVSLMGRRGWPARWPRWLALAALVAVSAVLASLPPRPGMGPGTSDSGERNSVLIR